MSLDHPTLLIVEDDHEIVETLRIGLRRTSYELQIAHDGKEALQLFDQYKPDLVLLDVMMPEMDGWDVLREIRNRAQTPVLMLTALGGDENEVSGLELGANDYLTKPFSMSVLLARINALLRRLGHGEERFEAGPYTFDMSARTAYLKGKALPLTPNEFLLFSTLARQPNHTFTRAELFTACWGQEYTGVERVVDVHLASLRRKLGDHNTIATVYGVGYRLDLDAEKS